MTIIGAMNTSPSKESNGFIIKPLNGYL